MEPHFLLEVEEQDIDLGNESDEKENTNEAS